MPNPEQATHWIEGANNFVPDMQLHSDVATNGTTKQYFKVAPVAASATAVLNAVSIASVIANIPLTITFTSTTRDQTFGPWGRALVVVLSAAGTPTITVRGRDYLGQPMTETIAATGTTPAPMKKAFKYVDRVDSSATVAGTLSIGTIDVFGLPFCANSLIQETVNDAVTGNAGTFVAAVKTDPATATTGDPRGTYAPNAANAANGSRLYQLLYTCDKNKLHGVRHYGA